MNCAFPISVKLVIYIHINIKEISNCYDLILDIDIINCNIRKFTIRDYILDIKML